MKPRVIVHSEFSLDGRNDPYVGDIGLYYETASKLGADATLTGSRTIVSGLEQYGDDSDVEAENASESPVSEATEGPLLAVVDSQGRISQWPLLIRQPYWSKIVVLCSRATPTKYIESLISYGIEYMVHGSERVDLGSSLAEMGDRYKVRCVRVDSGGSLTGALLCNGLVDEVSAIVDPYIVGGASEVSPLGHPGVSPGVDATRLTLHSVEILQGGAVWLRYNVTV